MRGRHHGHGGDDGDHDCEPAAHVLRVGGDTDPLNDCTRSFNFARRTATFLRKPADSFVGRAKVGKLCALSVWNLPQNEI
jgi:hypothetical protein